MNDRTGLVIDILRDLQGRMAGLERRMGSLEMRMSSIEDHMRGLVISTYALQSDMSDLKHRLDRVERRLGLVDFTH